MLEQVKHLACVEQPGHQLPRQARRTPEPRGRQHRAVLRQAYGGWCGSPTRSSNLVDVVEGEQSDQQLGVGLVEVYTARPDLRPEGLGVTAEQVESRQVFLGVSQASVPSASPASPSVVSVESPSVPSASPPRAVGVATGHGVATAAGRGRCSRCRRRSGALPESWSCQFLSLDGAGRRGLQERAPRTRGADQSGQSRAARTTAHTPFRGARPRLTPTGPCAGRSPRPRCAQRHRAWPGCWRRGHSPSWSR